MILSDRFFKSTIAFLFLMLGTSLSLRADITLPNVFGDHMVLQREQTNPVWGSAKAGATVTVQFAGQSKIATVDADGKWRVELDPLTASSTPRTLEVSSNQPSANSHRQFVDVLVGEVWICSGQSNMQWPLIKTNHADLSIASANYPEIRLLSVPQVGTPQAQDNFNGKWRVCSPATVAHFSAIGYLFGSRIHQTLGVPVGLINVAWGGSSAEAWMPLNVLEADNNYAELLDSWNQKVAAYTDEKHYAAVATFEASQAAGKLKPNQLAPKDIRVGQHRPANVFNGMLKPIIGYGMRGVIWYQGENNTSRSYQYRDLFPLMIRTWRDQWQQGDFPFYWVQLADFQPELKMPAQSNWSELREAQTMTLALPNTGQAVIIDVGEGRDIHPRDKTTVANRLARLALANDYGINIASQSPRYASMATHANKITLTFDHVSPEGLYAFDVDQPIGFSIAGSDKVFVWAKAKIVGKNKIEVFSPTVFDPVAVRYGWANNPIVNLYDRNGLPVTPFRTDDWPGLTINNIK